jgi:hypothetical protein
LTDVDQSGYHNARQRRFAPTLIDIPSERVIFFAGIASHRH